MRHRSIPRKRSGRHITQRLLPLFAILFMFTACVFPTDPSVLQVDENTAAGAEQIEVEQIEEDEAEPLADVDLSQTLVRANFLFDREVEDSTEQDVGEVEDLILDGETGQLLYIVVEYGGFLDIGDVDLAIPPAVFTWNDEAELVLPLDEADLEGLPAVDDDWPSVEAGDWDEGVDDFWLEAGFLEAELESLPVRASNLLDVTLGNVGTVAGVLEDLLLDLVNNQARYLAIQGEVGFWENDTEILVPFQALSSEVVGDERLFVVNTSIEVLEDAPEIDRELFLTVDFIDPALVDELDSFWEAQLIE